MHRIEQANGTEPPRRMCGTCTHWKPNCQTGQNECREGPPQVFVVLEGIRPDGAAVSSIRLGYPVCPAEFPACDRHKPAIATVEDERPKLAC